MNERRFIVLDEVTTEAVQWLWQDRIPLGGITVLDGDPGDGKSSIMYDLAARVTTGTPMPLTDDVVGPAGVVVLQAEDLLATTVRPNLEAAEADVSRVLAYDHRRFSNEPLLLHKPDDLEVVSDAIDMVSARLVIIDPFTAFVGSNTNSEANVRRVMGMLAKIAEEKAAAIVIVRHLAKGGSPKSKYRGTGSIGIIAAARSALLVRPDPGSDSPYQHVLGVTKSNLSDAVSVVYRTVKSNDRITVEWLGEDKHPIDPLSVSVKDHFDHSQLDEACYVLYSILVEHDQPLPAKIVQQSAADALVSQRTLKRAKKKLGVRSRRVMVESCDEGESRMQWVWELPGEDERVRPYRERALRELAQELRDGQGEPELTDTQTDVPLNEFHPIDRPWDIVESSDADSDTALDVPCGRPWSD